MKFLSTLIVAAIAPALAFAAEECNAERRIAIAQNITSGFNEPDFGKSLADVNAMPLTYDCPAIVYVNNAPGIEFGFDSTSTKDFANVVRQAFVNVKSKYTDYGNGTLLMDAIVTLGVLHYVQLPVYAHILVYIEYTNDCLISKLPAHVYVPTMIGGEPINPPIIPTIPGLETLPGFREILKQLGDVGILPGLLSP
ncbi:hypothetical protein PRZ48_007427 [Zasmidium cellare]|uniref:Secreted protein n=1 Tax=Zasmidium cellare TaxID=395010 RepID=A0ABR0EK63_ZASCE|nr:hypothetical protein PRZ48_007427 [Zasmidium cellare]